MACLTRRARGIRLTGLQSILICVYGLSVIGRSAFGDPSLERGWSSTIVVIAALGGANMLMPGVVGLYVGRIYAEAKAGPSISSGEPHALTMRPRLLAARRAGRSGRDRAIPRLAWSRPSHLGKCMMLCPESGPAGKTERSDAGVIETAIASAAAAARVRKGPTATVRLVVPNV